MWNLKLEKFSLKWLLIPAAALLFMMLKMEVGKKDCVEACKLKGYAHIRYQPARSSKYNSTPEHCTCLTEKESKIKKRIPKGLQLY